MLNKYLSKFGIVLAMSLWGINANAETFKVLHLFSHIVQNGCINEFNPDVMFGQFSNLKMDKCKKLDGKYFMSLTVPLDRPFSSNNAQQLKSFFDAYSSETNVPRQKLIEENLCKVTNMPKGASCLISFSDIRMLASAYDGVNYLTIDYVQP